MMLTLKIIINHNLSCPLTCLATHTPHRLHETLQQPLTVKILLLQHPFNQVFKYILQAGTISSHLSRCNMKWPCKSFKINFSLSLSLVAALSIFFFFFSITVKNLRPRRRAFSTYYLPT